MAKRLIDADALINGIALYAAENAYLNDTPLDVLKMVADWVTNAPTVDAVEVVLCKECKRFVDNKEAMVTYCRRSLMDMTVRPDDFCSYGERKEK